MSFSVVILSKNAANLEVCWNAILHRDAASKVIVVDDGLSNRDIEGWGEPVRIIDGEKPFIFARNANIGIHAAGDDNVIILNDDALLQTPSGFSALERVSQEHPEFGVIAATCNSVGNPNQFPQNVGLREDPRMVCFVCVYIPRSTINAVGLLDERFTGYGMDDDDYCLRVRKAGLKIGIYDGCFVDHLLLKSEFRGHGCGDFRPNLELFKQKWGVDNWGNPA
jgi:GT2 family glycosyltransferase